jgi:TPP-dependent indolepyruvate ferredoxin oxidoreductase alpha subunit
VIGNGAIALGALSAGVSLVAGYPGTPSSEIIDPKTLANRRNNADILSVLFIMLARLK